MPELPEVETIARQLNTAKLRGKRVVEVHVFWSRSIAIPEEHLFCKKIIGQKINKIFRRGKFLVFGLTDYTLLVHLRMSGKVILSDVKAPISHFERLRFLFEDGKVLSYIDQRKFGKWYLLDDPNIILKKLGIEPLSEEFTPEVLRDLLLKRKTRIKPFLLDQRKIAGLGNIYVDEALWQAKIHPLRPAHSLTKREIINLHDTIREVLLKAITNMGTSLGDKLANYKGIKGKPGKNRNKLNIYGRTGKLCPRCESEIIKIVIAQRGTHICPKCQTIN